jgi:ribose 5-phosphate isomerase A
VLADYHGALDDPAQWAERFGATPGVVEHGLFPPSMVSLVVVGRGDEAESFGPAV